MTVKGASPHQQIHSLYMCLEFAWPSLVSYIRQAFSKLMTKHARYNDLFNPGRCIECSSHSSLISWSQRWMQVESTGFFSLVLLHSGTVIASFLVELLDMFKLDTESTSKWALWLGYTILSLSNNVPFLLVPFPNCKWQTKHAKHCGLFNPYRCIEVVLE